MAAQHVQIVLAVLADLRLVGINQGRTQCLQHFVYPQLRGRPRRAMGERDVASVTRLNAQADADQIGLHRIQAIGFGIEGEAIGSIEFL